MLDKKYATKQDLIDFAKTIGESFNLLKKEMAELKIRKSEEVFSPVSNSGFLQSQALFLYPNASPKNQQKFNTELQDLMIKHKVGSVMGTLYHSS